MDGWLDGWTDKWVFVCVPLLGSSSATAIQAIYTDQFLFLCATVKKIGLVHGCEPGIFVREKLPNRLFCIVLSILHPFTVNNN